jgi:hypothetical protein
MISKEKPKRLGENPRAALLYSTRIFHEFLTVPNCDSHQEAHLTILLCSPNYFIHSQEMISNLPDLVKPFKKLLYEDIMFL